MTSYSPSMLSELNAQSAAFRFVALLAAEVSNGQIDLPAFPEVVARVKNALSRDDVTPVQIAQVVTAEAGLAARLMTMANSAIMNPGGKPITELKSAIVRIGYNNVRTSAVAYAVAKLKQAQEVQAIRQDLEALWREATTTAAVAWAIAKHTAKFNADEALLAGLVHNIGKVYILSRSQRMAGDAFKVSDIVAIVRDWHANVGRAILEAWKFPAAIVVAVGDHEEFDRPLRQGDLADVLQLAVVIRERLSNEKESLNSELLKSDVVARLGLNREKLGLVLHDTKEALDSLRGALGG